MLKAIRALRTRLLTVNFHVSSINDLSICRAAIPTEGRPLEQPAASRPPNVRTEVRQKGPRRVSRQRRRNVTCLVGRRLEILTTSTIQEVFYSMQILVPIVLSRRNFIMGALIRLKFHCSSSTCAWCCIGDAHIRLKLRIFA